MEKNIFRQSFENAPVALFHATADGQILRANRQFAEMLGYDRSELVGRFLREFEYSPGIKADIDARAPKRYVEKRLIRKDGSLLQGLLSVSVARFGSRGESYLICALSKGAGQEIGRPERAFTGAEFPVINGRILEPHAKEILKIHQLDVPRFLWAKTGNQAIGWARAIGYPVVAKVISPMVYCKSSRGGIETDIGDDAQLLSAFRRFSRFPEFMGILVEERISQGLALNVGITRMDSGADPAIFLERGGFFSHRLRGGVRQIPEMDVREIRSALRRLRLLSDEGADNAPEVNETVFARTLSKLFRIVTDPAAVVETVILNPVLCTPERCIILDVRMKCDRQPTAELPVPAHADGIGCLHMQILQ